MGTIGGADQTIWFRCSIRTLLLLAFLSLEPSSNGLARALDRRNGFPRVSDWEMARRVVRCLYRKDLAPGFVDLMGRIGVRVYAVFRNTMH
jgi:hypothetical protein